MAEDDEQLGRIHREPQIAVASLYSTVGTVREVVRMHDSGDFANSSLLIEQMQWNPRLRGVLETRLNGLLSTSIRWEPGRKNAAARRAAAAIEEDFPLMADPATRKSMHAWGLMAGFCPGQRAWYRSGSSGREIPRIQVFHPHWWSFDWERQVYRVQVASSPMSPTRFIEVDSPSLLAGDDPLPDTWLLHEPFGQHSWRHGLFHAAWYAWLGHGWADRDQSRAAEKLGIGILKARYPIGTADTSDAKTFVSGIRKVNSEGVIPCGETQDGRKWDVEPLEFTGTGYEMIRSTKDSKAVDLAVLFLGHNLTTEAKGGSYAAANVGDLIRGDIKAFDAAAEAATLRRQVIAAWAERNFGDAELAPIPIYETDPPAVNLTSAQTMAQLAQALNSFARVPGVDLLGLAARYRVPLVQVPAQAAVPPPAATTVPPAETPAPAQVVPGGDAPALASEGGGSQPAASEATLALTPTDIAAIVRVNEARRSIKLPELADETGQLWVREHAAKVGAAVAPLEAQAAGAAPPLDETAGEPDEDEGDAP